ncbi:SVM family protein [Candidatus Phytoplasma bonamiae]|uniref:SVM family protein n=1 Tax=Candidatus Phytoplasma bonamiae TaxID=2982626 RepID=A0ABT9D7G7_9MOLU|nr:SVM family protein ['Bonamia sp.' little leaf phytoplasma]MDO8064051.1 SVM family protein ['Bonamia sp.' little leaf phytoplasma]
MMQVKNKLFLPFFLMIYLGLFLLININSVMAMENNNKNQQKEDYELLDKEIDNLNEGIKYFNKKGIQINLDKIAKLLSTRQKNNPTESSSSNSKKIKLY